MSVRCVHRSLQSLFSNPVFSVRNTSHISPSCIYLKQTVCAQRCIATSPGCLKGHSKWQNIRHTKGAKDKERAIIIGRYTKMIRSAVKVGGPEAKYNSELTRAIARAKENEVPVVRIEQAIKEASKTRDTGSALILEASGPGNSAIIIDVFTDNVNRTKHSIGAAVKKVGGKVREHGYARRMFECKGNLIVHLTETDGKTVDDFLDIAIEAGAEDVQLEDGEDGGKILTFISSEEEMYAVKKSLQDTYEIKTIEKDYIPKRTVSLSEDEMIKAEKLFENLDNVEEVVGYVDNIEMPS